MVNNFLRFFGRTSSPSSPDNEDDADDETRQFLSTIGLVVQGRVFQVHPAYFADKSEVFRKLFRTKRWWFTRSREVMRVEINDINVEVFEHALLPYLYKGEHGTAQFEQNVEYLLSVAHKVGRIWF